MMSELFRVPDWLLGLAILVAAIALSIAVHRLGAIVVRRAGGARRFCNVSRRESAGLP